MSANLLRPNPGFQPTRSRALAAVDAHRYLGYEQGDATTISASSAARSAYAEVRVKRRAVEQIEA